MEASYIIDFEKCVKNGIDAIELCWYGYEYKNTDYLHSRIDKNLHYLLYGWDCDCILIMNPNIIIPIN